MHSIGEISKLVNISVDALRYYDEIGLFKPHHIDEKNRYRYYSNDQICDLMMIMELKSFGMSLETIRNLLVGHTPERMRAALQARERELQQEQRLTAVAIEALQRKMEQLDKRSEDMKQPSVLIVDDSDFMRDILGSILPQHRYQVAGQASSGEEGVAKFKLLLPDLVIMDIGMPGKLDGLAAARYIIDHASHARIVFCSARGQVGNVIQSVLSGAAAFVVKPFMHEFLLQALSQALEDIPSINKTTAARWLADDKLAQKFGSESLVQEDIAELWSLLRSHEDTVDNQLLNLLSHRRTLAMPS